MSTARFQEIEGSDNVRLDEIARPAYRTIYMRFRRQMHHMRNGMLLHDTKHHGFVAQINHFKSVFGMLCDQLKISKMPRISQAVEVDEFGDLRPINDMLNQVRANETGTAGDE